MRSYEMNMKNMMKLRKKRSIEGSCRISVQK